MVDRKRSLIMRLGKVQRDIRELEDRLYKETDYRTCENIMKQMEEKYYIVRDLQEKLTDMDMNKEEE